MEKEFEESLEDRVKRLKKLFLTDITRDMKWRLKTIKEIRSRLYTYQQELIHALCEDLGRSSFWALGEFSLAAVTTYTVLQEMPKVGKRTKVGSDKV